MMKKKVCSVLLIAAMLCTMCLPMNNADAAKKVTLNAKKCSMSIGESKTIRVKGKVKPKKTTWLVKNKKLVKFSKKTKTSVKIKAVKAGSTVLTGKIKLGRKLLPASVKS